MSNNTTNTTTSYVLAVVTGASGFVGSAVALRFLDLGHSVRLPLRTPQQGEAWIKQYGDKYPGKIETVVLEGSITEKGVFDKILEGCDVVVHAASPATFTVNDPETDILKPALAGTLSLLESAKKTASVKSVVLTSSLSAFASAEKFDSLAPDFVFTEDSWNTTTYEEAAKLSKDKGVEIYSASKGISEKAAWQFMEDNDVHFMLSTVAPTFVTGRLPVPGVDKLRTDAYSSFGILLNALWNKKEFPPHDGTAFHPRFFVSVNDVAHAHVSAALNRDTANGHRYLVTADDVEWEQVAAAMIKSQPELKKHLPPLPEKVEGVKVLEHRHGGDRAAKDFGFEYEPFDEYIGACAAQIVELAKANGQL